MRVLTRSAFIAAVLVSSFSLAQANPIYSEPSLSARTGHLALRFGSGLWGVGVIDGYRTIDGKNLYHEDSSPKLSNRIAFPGVFATSGYIGGDSRPIVSFNSSGSSSANPGKGGYGTFGSGGNDGFSFGGAQSGTGGGVSGSSLKGVNPLEFAYTNLNDGHGGLQEFGEGGGGKAEISATPLPSSWTLMLIGLGAFGLIARRQRRNEKPFATA